MLNLTLMTNEIAATTAAETAQQFHQSTLQLDLNRLESALIEEQSENGNSVGKNRLVKRRALESIASATTGTANISPGKKAQQWSVLSRADKQAIAKIILPVLLQCWKDPTEKCRELSITLIGSYLKEDALLISECLPQIMETLAERLLPVDPRQSADSLGNNFGTSSSDLLGVYSNTSLAIEPAEELRLQLVSVLAESINALGRQCAEREQFVELILPFMDRLNRIISATLCDSFHEVKKESCRVLTALGQLASRAVGMLSLDRLSASLFSIIFHKHSAVRTAAVQALGVLIKADAKPLEEQQTVDLLYRLAGDKTPATREALFTVVCDWLLQLRDRYGYAPRLLGLVLYGVTDDIERVRQMVSTKIDQMASMYEYDNEERLKDELDYCEQEAFLANRPRIGARHLFRDNTQQTLKRLLENCASWSPDVRVKSFQCLLALLPYTEHNITGYVSQVLTCLLRIAGEDPKDCLPLADRIVEMMSLYVKSNAYLAVLLPVIAAPATALPTLALALRFMSHMLRSSPNKQFSVDEDVQLLLDGALVECVVECQDQAVSDYLVETVRSIVETLNRLHYGHDGGKQDELFRLLYATLSLISRLPAHRAELEKILSGLSQLTGCASRFELLMQQSDRLLGKFEACAVDSWSRHSRQPHILLTLFQLESNLIDAEGIYGRVETLLIRMAQSHGGTEMNFDNRKLAMDCVALLIKQSNMIREDVTKLKRVLEDVLLPNMLWYGDKRSVTVRLHAISVMQELLQPQPVHDAHSSVWLSMLHRLVGGEKYSRTGFRILLDCTDDEMQQTRLVAINLLCELLALKPDLTDEQTKELYGDALKRLDDAQDSVRQSVCRLFSIMLRADGLNGMTQLDRIHHEHICQQLFIHLDDSNPAVREAVCQALMSGKGGVLGEELVSAQAQSVSANFRHQDILKRFL